MLRLTLARLSRWSFVCAVCAVLGTPLLTHHWRSEQTGENREASPLPSAPHSWSEMLAWPKLVDAYLADHFGGRMAMVEAFNWTRFQIFGETPSKQTVVGGHGRIFLTSHSAASPYSLIRFICGAGVDDTTIDQAIANLGDFLLSAGSATRADNNYLLVVPTAPTLYFSDLPPWLRTQCPRANTMDRLMQRLPRGDLHRRLLYPLTGMLAAKTQGEVIPLTNFHWKGVGAEAAAVSFAEGTLGLTRRLLLPTRTVMERSDIAHLMPGVPTGNLVRLPDFSGTGIDYCDGSACFPELGPMAPVIADLSRLHSPQAGDKKLLILSDSFGAAIVGWFAPYFRSVYHFSVSNLGRLSKEDRRLFSHWIFSDYRPDVVLYLFHDGSVHYWTHIASQGLWED